MSETRRLAAILAADVVGFSRLAGADEDRTLARLRALRSDLIDPAFAVHHGRVVKRTGDGAIVEFRSVVDAVRCATEIQNAMVERNSGLAEDQRIVFRIGIHVGDVVEEDDGDLMGEGINIAARLEGVAAPGAICLSETAYWQVKSRLDLKVTDLGPTSLKNIAEPVRVYSLEVGSPAKPGKPRRLMRRWPAAAVLLVVAALALGAYAWRSGLTSRIVRGSVAEDRLASAPHLSIVVLPFANLSNDADQDYFADGITDDLTTDLSHLQDSFVIARNTAFTYKGKAVDVKEIGRELGVRYVLEGSVRRVGEAITINAQLISTDSGAHIWADRFEGERAKLGQLQVEVVARIANALGAELIRAESLRALREHPDNPDAIDLALRATLAGQRMDNKESMNLFEQALKLDPNLTRAQAGLAITLTNLASYPDVTDRSAYLDRAEILADQALHAQPDYVFALYAKAMVLAARKQIEAAILEGEAAIKVDPNYPGPYARVAFWKGLAGRSEQGLADIETAIRLSPRDPVLWLSEFFKCSLHVNLAQWDQAIAACEQSLAANPKHWAAYFYLAAAYSWLGRDAEAKAELAEGLRLAPGATVKNSIAYAGTLSDNAIFLQQVARMTEGLRRAGLPNQ